MADLAALAAHARLWGGAGSAGAASLDPAASGATAWWLLAVLAYGLSAAVLLGGEARAARLVLMALVACGALHAAVGLALAPFGLAWPSADPSTEVRGSFVSHNQAAAFWGLLLPSALLLWARHGSRWAWAVAALAIAIVGSNSRGGVLCAAVVVLPLAFSVLPARRRVWWTLAAARGLAVVLWVVNLHPLTARFGELADRHEVSVQGRLRMWQAYTPIAGTR